MRKQIKLFSLFLASAIVPLLLSQCKSKKDMVQDETVIEVPCSGPEYSTSKDYFRANSVGESSNQAQSKRIAMSNVRAEIAGNIETTVRSVVENYTQEMATGATQEYSGKFQAMTREIVDQKLQGTRIICEKLTKTPEGRYKTYIAIELAGDEILNSINDQISNDDEMKVNYEREKFTETYKEEMENL